MSRQIKPAVGVAAGTFFRVEDYRIYGSVGYLVGRTKTALSMTTGQEVVVMDVTHSQTNCLALLASSRRQAATDLGRELNTDIDSLTRMPSRVEKHGLIECVHSKSDRRVMYLEVTKAGWDLTNRTSAIYTHMLNRFFVGFTSGDVDTLRGFLKRILDNGTAIEGHRIRPADHWH